MIRRVFCVFFLLFPVSILASNKDYSALLAGKHIILDGATCAGIAFESETKAFLIPELNCIDMLETRVKWIRPDIFVLTETERVNEQCPPRNWIYQVLSHDKNQIKVRSFWTGWNNYEDEARDYKITDFETP